MQLPDEGMSPATIFAHLDDLQQHDVRWREGRAFSLVYYAGAEVLAVAEEAYRRYATENALNTDAFPGLRTIQSEVVAIVGGWLEAGDEGAGFMTSGGTESILMAVKAARDEAARSVASRRRTWCCRPVPTLRSRRAATTSASRVGVCRSTRDWRADVGGDGGGDRRQHGAAGRLGAAVSARCDRPDSRDRGTRRGARHQLSRRRVHGWRHVDLHGEAR